MRLKIQDIRNALHPSEVVVVFDTSDGTETVVVDRASIADHWLEIGQPLREEGGKILVELPRETDRGAWRVWVPQANVASKAA